MSNAAVVTPVTITFREARAAGACDGSCRRMRGAKPGWGDVRPFPVEEVLDLLGLDDALWALFVVDEPVWRLLACEFAERVLPAWEAYAPADTRPRDAIQAARRYARGEVEAAPAAGAARAAWAAWAARAAWAAERLRAVLRGELVLS